jgi:hypothetical protein
MEKFILDNGLFYTFNENGSGQYLVCNYTSVGLIPPGRIQGQGATLEAAVKEYMTVAQGERVAQKDYLTAYVAEPTADAKVAEAFVKDERVAVELKAVETEAVLGEKVP